MRKTCNHLKIGLTLLPKSNKAAIPCCSAFQHFKHFKTLLPVVTWATHAKQCRHGVFHMTPSPCAWCMQGGRKRQSVIGGILCETQNHTLKVRKLRQMSKKSIEDQMSKLPLSFNTISSTYGLMIPGTTKKIRGWPISPKIGHRSSSRMNKRTFRGTWTVFVYLLYAKSFLQNHSRSHNIHVWHIYLHLGCFNGIATSPFLVSTAMDIPNPPKKGRSVPQERIRESKTLKASSGHFWGSQNTKNLESGIRKNGLWITKISCFLSFSLLLHHSSHQRNPSFKKQIQ